MPDPDNAFKEDTVNLKSNYEEDNGDLSKTIYTLLV